VNNFLRTWKLSALILLGAGLKLPAQELTFSVRLSEHWVIRTVFDRVTSNYNRDSDIFLMGLGYRWPR
jgi:hypothetical protein